MIQAYDNASHHKMVSLLLASIVSPHGQVILVLILCSLNLALVFCFVSSDAVLNIC